MPAETGSFLAFPLRLQDGFLRRTGPTEAVLSLLQIMAATSHGSWKGSAQFGVREFFEQARRYPELPEMAVQVINEALKDLGITDVQVESIARDPAAEADTDSYSVTLSSGEQNVRKPFRFLS
ncbi:MAG TPA: hypothetical protein VKX25_18725 [Bryobacteraceae bacterium]|nr:hypothetical protein [Bryobacteraceae bacterium]